MKLRWRRGIAALLSTVMLLSMPEDWSSQQQPLRVLRKQSKVLCSW